MGEKLTDEQARQKHILNAFSGKEVTIEEVLDWWNRKEKGLPVVDRTIRRDLNKIASRKIRGMWYIPETKSGGEMTDFTKQDLQLPRDDNTWFLNVRNNMSLSQKFGEARRMIITAKDSIISRKFILPMYYKIGFLLTLAKEEMGEMKFENHVRTRSEIGGLREANGYMKYYSRSKRCGILMPKLFMSEIAMASFLRRYAVKDVEGEASVVKGSADNALKFILNRPVRTDEDDYGPGTADVCDTPKVVQESLRELKKILEAKIARAQEAIDWIKRHIDKE